MALPVERATHWRRNAGDTFAGRAHELGVLREMVQTHVSHILGKLWFSSRVEIAREATRHPVAGG